MYYLQLTALTTLVKRQFFRIPWYRVLYLRSHGHTAATTAYPNQPYSVLCATGVIRSCSMEIRRPPTGYAGFEPTISSVTGRRHNR